MTRRVVPLLTIGVLIALHASCSLITDFTGISDLPEDGGGSEAPSAIDAESVDRLPEARSDAAQTEADAAASCPDAGSAEYEIAELGSDQELAMDGRCDDPIWKALPGIPFYQNNNTSDNTVNCRLAWKHAEVDRIYGCCEMGDTDIEAKITDPDAGVWMDDGIEYFLRGDETRALGATTSKVLMNAIGTVADYDFGSSFGWWSASYDAKVIVEVHMLGTPNSPGDVDTGYSLEWSADVGFQVDPPRRGLCSFAMGDTDDTNGNRDWLAFAPDGGVSGGTNEPLNWGTCLFSCRRAGGP